MKLVVCAPSGEITEEAQKLAEQFGLPIKTDSSYTSVDVCALPETKSISYKNTISTGHIYSIKVIDEFNVLLKNTLLRYSGPESGSILPLVSERHMSIFHNRFSIPGHYLFDIVLGEDEILFSGEVHVTDS